MTLPENGTARKALISGAIGLAFAVAAWGGKDVLDRITRLEREADRIGKIAAGRGDRIESLERRVEHLEQRPRPHRKLEEW